MVLLLLQPLPETVALVEDIVVEYVTDLVSLFCVLCDYVSDAEMLCSVIVRLCGWKKKQLILCIYENVFNDFGC